jgi:predicted lipoprotein with Yx(FWY)xxD motif
MTSQEERMTTRLRSRWLAVPFAASLLLAACGDDDNSTDTGGTTTAGGGTSATTTPTTAGTSGGGDYGGPGGSATTVVDGAAAGSVALADGGDLGQILVDADGMTLYVYGNDTEGASTCNDQCATGWPPYVADSGTAGDGVTGDVTVITRDDGDKQVAINGQPLYRFAGDAAAGDTNGQGAGGVWHVVDAAGEPVGM